LLSKFTAPTGTMAISCYHCGQLQDVARRAQTVTCRHCSKPLQVGDVQVKRYDARREVKTVGSLVVEKKGRVVTQSVTCGGLIARGEVTAKTGTTVRGLALIGPKATLGGTFEAISMAVSEGATLEGNYCVGKDHMKPPEPPPVEEIKASEAMPDPTAVDQPAEPVASEKPALTAAA
jgi:hypothetical protein